MSELPGCFGCCDALKFVYQAMSTIALVFVVSFIIKVLTASTSWEDLDTYAINSDYWTVFYVVTTLCILLWLVCFVWYICYRRKVAGYSRVPVV